MEFDSELSLLSSKFTQAYPPATYPELMHKHGRPYTCLLIDSHDDYFICVPFRSSIGHKNAFMFTGTARSKKTKSGLDYSKIAIIKNIDYFDSITAAIVDQDNDEKPSNYCSGSKRLCGYIHQSYQRNHTSTSTGIFTKISILYPALFSRYYGNLKVCIAADF